MIRPNDIHGNPVEMGPWYWARSRTGKIVGVGKFASTIGSDEIIWFINGTGYGFETFEFVKAVEPDFKRSHDWCANASCPICSEDFRKQIQ